jgi:hypothetical protein
MSDAITNNEITTLIENELYWPAVNELDQKMIDRLRLGSRKHGIWTGNRVYLSNFR